MVRRRSYLINLNGVVAAAHLTLGCVRWVQFRAVVFLKPHTHPHTKLRRPRRYRRRHYNQLLPLGQLFANWAATYRLGANLAKIMGQLAAAPLMLNAALVPRGTSISAPHWGGGAGVRGWRNAATHPPSPHPHIYWPVGGRWAFGQWADILDQLTPQTPLLYQMQRHRYVNLVVLVRWVGEFNSFIDILLTLHLNWSQQLRWIYVLMYLKVKGIWFFENYK